MNNYQAKYILLIMALILLSNCTPSDHKVEDKIINNNSRSLPPNTSEIFGTIQEVNDSSQSIFCSVKIDTVFGYGHSTPTIAVGTNLKVRINNNDFTDGKLSKDLIRINKGFYFELKSQKLTSLNNSDFQWSAIKISQNRHSNK